MLRLRIVMVDDHVLVVEGIRRLLERDYDIVAVVGDGRAAVETAMRLKPDIMLLDIAMPLLNGIEAARQIREMEIPTKVIFVTMQTDRDYVRVAFRAGAAGYVLKQAAPSELIEAIQAVVAGGLYLSPSIAPRGSQELLNGLGEASDRFAVPLTTRQREVLQLIAEGKSAKEIAHFLAISPKTVEFHKAGIMDVLGLRTTAELTRYAMEHGIVCR
jgi:DNA-binding NarL/FixJ family response regulator